MLRLAKYKDCTGCMACYNSCSHNAIEIVNDKEGFLQPVVKADKCVECKLCENSCPVMTPFEPRDTLAIAGSTRVNGASTKDSAYTIMYNPASADPQKLLERQERINAERKRNAELNGKEYERFT